MLIPIKDTNTLRHIRFAYVTVGLIALCGAVFIAQQSQGAHNEALVHGLGTIPSVLTGNTAMPSAQVMVPPAATLVTSMFLHGSWMHLLGNMLFLWVFGDNVEDAMGHGRFLIFYLLCGVIAALAHVASDPTSQVPTIGASGAISGVLGAYLVLHPRAQVLALVFRFFIHLPAIVVLLGWLALQVVSVWTTPAGEGGVAWWAHIGGFVAGALLVVPFRRRGVALFGKSSTPGVARRTIGQGRSIFPTTRKGPWG